MDLGEKGVRGGKGGRECINVLTSERNGRALLGGRAQRGGGEGDVISEYSVKSGSRLYTFPRATLTRKVL